MHLRSLVLLGLFLILKPAFSQEEESLLDLLGPEDPVTNYASASFKTTRVINSHSIENAGHGVMDFKIGHRFGRINSGAYEFFGMDQATIRLGLDYGITDRLMIGIGRSSYEKTLDGFIKYKLLRQSTGAVSMPVTVVLVAGTSINMLRFPDNRENFATSRFAYFFQPIIGRKFSEYFSIQLMPTLVHRNLVRTFEEEHDVIALGIAGRQKITKRIALTAEYFYLLPDQIPEQYHNSLTIGFDIETGGHVFQLHFTNSLPLMEKGFITETTGNWADGDIHFGFNISRVFQIHKPSKKSVE